ncbi:MAG: hypothetical protein KDD01_11885 [Phaeodactylibacter sp.]|nr:hypothetical protein [Phaeodactylibacter sp.]
MISVFVNKETDEATMKLYHILDGLNLPDNVNITINNLKDAESGVLREDGKVVDVSLANCYTLEDVVRELVGLVARQEKT